MKKKKNFFFYEEVFIMNEEGEDFYPVRDIQYLQMVKEEEEEVKY